MKQRACPVAGARASNEQRPMECSGARSAGGEHPWSQAVALRCVEAWLAPSTPHTCTSRPLLLARAAPVAVRPRLTPWMDAARAGGVVVRDLQ